MYIALLKMHNLHCFCREKGWGGKSWQKSLQGSPALPTFRIISEWFGGLAKEMAELQSQGCRVFPKKQSWN